MSDKSINEIEGLSKEMLEKLQRLRIKTIDEFLGRLVDPIERKSMGVYLGLISEEVDTLYQQGIKKTGFDPSKSKHNVVFGVALQVPVHNGCPITQLHGVASECAHFVPAAQGKKWCWECARQRKICAECGQTIN